MDFVPAPCAWAPAGTRPTNRKRTTVPKALRRRVIVVVSRSRKVDGGGIVSVSGTSALYNRPVRATTLLVAVALLLRVSQSTSAVSQAAPADTTTVTIADLGFMTGSWSLT